MKKHSIHFLFLAALLASCQPGTRKEQNVDQHISRVENGLLPSIVLASDTAPQMNILDRMKHYHVPGLSIAVINHGRIEWAKGYGFADSAGTRPVDTHTLFQAASISKPVAALAALSMVEEGYFPLDEDVNHYLQSWKVPENRFTEEEKVTLRRLLSHSAGLTVHGFDGYEAGSPLPSIQQILNGEPPANSPAVVADTTPGAINRYSGGGYTVMQLLMQESAGQAFPALMKEKVLIPLQMENSTYEQPLPVSLSANAAVGHDQRGRPVPGNWHTYPEMAAAGLWTTPTDLARFAIELEGSYLGTTNRILTKEMTR